VGSRRERGGARRARHNSPERVAQRAQRVIQPPPGQVDPPTRFRWVVLAGVWLVYATFGMATVSLAPLVAPIQRDLDVSHAMMGFVLGAWQAVFIASAVPCGTLIDRIGARLALPLASIFIAASGFMRAVAPDAATLWVAVAVFGVGGPIVSIAAPKMISGWFHGAERGLAMGIYGTGPAVGSILTLSLTNSVMMPTLGGDWRAVLQVWAGVALGAGVLWMLMAASGQMRRADAASPVRSQPASASGKSSGIGEMLRVPSVRMLLAMALGIFAFNHSLNNWLPEILRARGMSPAEAGFWATVPTLVGIVSSLTLPRLATPGRRYRILLMLCVSATLASLMLQAENGSVLLAGLVVQGIARASLTTIMILMLVEMPGIGEARAGVASGLFFSAGEVGGALGPLMLGALHDVTGGFGAGLAILTTIGLGLIVGARRMQYLARRENPAVEGSRVLGAVGGPDDGGNNIRPTEGRRGEPSGRWDRT
jgi:cyanate permease